MAIQSPTKEEALEHITNATNEFIQGMQQNNKEMQRHGIVIMGSWIKYFKKRDTNSKEHIQAMREIIKIGELYPQYKELSRAIATDTPIKKNQTEEYQYQLDVSIQNIEVISNEIINGKSLNQKKLEMLFSEIYKKCSYINKNEKNPEKPYLKRALKAIENVVQARPEYKMYCEIIIKDHANNTMSEYQSESAILIQKIEKYIKNFEEEVESNNMVNINEIEDRFINLQVLRRNLYEYESNINPYEFERIMKLLESKISFCEETIEYNKQIESLDNGSYNI